jgi:hypothetical protein
VWLRDFPHNAADFKELRRSAAQHTPEVDIALHGVILIDEKFKRNYDEEPQVDPNAEISPEQLAQDQELRRHTLEEEYSMVTVQNAFKDLLYINKYT